MVGYISMYLISPLLIVYSSDIGYLKLSLYLLKGFSTNDNIESSREQNYDQSREIIRKQDSP